MDYGDRQERALFLVNRLRESQHQDRVYTSNTDGKIYTPADIADEIEKETELGKEILAIAGLVFHAMRATPEFFESKDT